MNAQLQIQPLLLFCFLVLGFFILVSPSCVTPEQDYPSYIKIDTIMLETTNMQGSNSHKISHFWLFVNGFSLGAYELPAIVPVLDGGINSGLTIRAGVVNNGLADFRIIYPFYNAFSATEDLFPLDTLSLEPVFNYNDNIDFDLITDFEISNDFQNLDAAEMTVTNDPELVFEGNRSGIIELNEIDTAFIVETINSYSLPLNQVPSYLEFNYKCESPFRVFINGISTTTFQTGSLIGVNTKSTWNKFYVDLTSSVGQLNSFLCPDASSNCANYKIVFAGELPTGQTSSTILFDNIKLIHEN